MWSLPTTVQKPATPSINTMSAGTFRLSTCNVKCIAGVLLLLQLFPDAQAFCALSLRIAPDSARYAAGATISYSYQLRNTGRVPLSDIVIVSSINATCTVAGALAAGEVARCTGTYGPMAQERVDSCELVVNEARATGSCSFSDSERVYVTSTEISVMEPDLDVGLQLKVTPSFIVAAVGEVLEFEYTVRNVGSYPMSSITLSSDLGANCLVTGGLNSLQTKSCKAFYTVAESDKLIYPVVTANTLNSHRKLASFDKTTAGMLLHTVKATGSFDCGERIGERERVKRSVIYVSDEPTESNHVEHYEGKASRAGKGGLWWRW